MSVLSKDAILTAADLKTETVQVPEWGGEVRVRSLTGTERDSFERTLFVGEGENKVFTSENARAKLLVRTIVDDDGKRVFEDGDDVILGNRNAAALDRLYDVAQRLSGIGKEKLEQAVKN